MNSRASIITLTAILMAAGLLVPGCRHDVFDPSSDRIVGSGKIVSEERSVPTFNGIQMNGTADVVITQSPTQSLRVEADDNIIGRLRTRVESGTLVIDLEPGSYEHTTVNVHASMSAVRLLECNGAGDFSATGPISSEYVEFRINGTGHFALYGTAHEQTVVISGAGEVHNFGLETKNSNVSISGAGSVEVHATDRLDASIAGTGNIVYAGNPRFVHQSIQGVGTIERRP